MTMTTETFSPFGALDTNVEDVSPIQAATASDLSPEPMRAPLTSPFG